MFDPKQFRFLVRGTLEELEGISGIPWSKEAETLLLMTAAHESKLGTYLVQTRGPAQGVFQMEPATFKDLRANYLAFRPDVDYAMSQFFVDPEDPYEVSWNLKAAIVAARLQYRRIPEPLPVTLEDKARYAKTHWNTELGKATPEDYFKAYKEAYLD